MKNFCSNSFFDNMVKKRDLLKIIDLYLMTSAAHLLFFTAGRRSGKNQNKSSKFDTSKLMSYRGHKMDKKITSERMCLKIRLMQHQK
jgi:hypothetical protein